MLGTFRAPVGVVVSGQWLVISWEKGGRSETCGTNVSR